MIFMLSVDFLKINFFQTFFQKHSVSNSFDADQAEHFVGPDLSPNCLERSAGDTKFHCKQSKSYYTSEFQGTT